MRKTIITITIASAIIFSFLLLNPVSRPSAVTCDPAMGGDYTVDESCTFSTDNTVTAVGDSSTNANDGTVTGTTIVTAGKYGSARSFNGSSDYINVPHSTSLNISSTITVEGWVYLNSTGNRWILGKEPVNSTYELFAEGTYFVMRINDCVPSCRHALGGTQVVDTWTHVAGTYDGQNIRLYVNGSLVDTEPYVAAITTNTSPVQIGAFSSGTSYQMDGYIDDVRIYNYVRSEDQINEDMSNGPTTGTAPVSHWRMNDGYVHGIDNGNLVIPDGKTLTINAGQTIVWNPGKSITIASGGYIAITSPGQLKQSYLWVPDSDSDGWYYRNIQVIADSQPTGYVRRNTAIGPVFGDGSDGSVTFNTNTNINTTAVATGRTAPDGPNYRICNAIGTNYIDTCSAGPIGLWYMNETSNNSCSGGQDACDSSGNGNHGTATGTTIVTGKYSNGRSFNGTSDAIGFGSTGRPANTFTFMAWFNTNVTHQIDAESTSSTTGTSGQRYLFWPANEGSNSGAGLSVGTNGISVYEHSSGYMPPLAVYSGTLPAGWNHVAVVYSSKQPKIYLNGTLVRTGLTSPKTTVYAPINVGGGGYGYHSGNIDDVRIYNYARGSNLIEDDMNSWQAALAPGDTVMLMNLMGDATNYGNAGNYELLKVLSVSGRRITFTTNIKKIYGATTTNTNVAGQKIIIQRVPQYSNVTINDGVTVTAKAFDGYKDGVFAMQANGTLTLNSGAYGGGIIHMSEKGYRGANNVQYAGEQGESYKGLGSANTQTANLGAGGGGGTVANNVAGGGGGSYGAVGTAGKHGSTSGFIGQPGTLGGAVGATYGTTALSKAYMGSGGGSGAYSYTGQADGGNGGGIILINAATLSLAGSIKSNGENGEAGSGPEGTQAGGGGGGSGGSIRISGSSVTLGSGLATATGGTGGGGCYKTCHDSGGGNGGSGRVAVYYVTSLSGTTSPAAYSSQVSDAGGNIYLAEVDETTPNKFLDLLAHSFKALLQ